MLPVFEILSGEEQLSLYGGTQNSKQGFRCFDLAVCDQEDPLQSANCWTGNIPSCWHFQWWCYQNFKCFGKPWDQSGNQHQEILHHSQRKSLEAHKEKRKKTRQRKNYIDTLVEKEGAQYQAGAFWASNLNWLFSHQILQLISSICHF